MIVTYLFLTKNNDFVMSFQVIDFLHNVVIRAWLQRISVKELSAWRALTSAIRKVCKF